MNVLIVSPKFVLGRIVATPHALTAVHTDDIHRALIRHASGDWGELEAQDVETNERALKHGGRLFSQYRSGQGVKFWIITEHDRSATTILLPEDY